ncbi:MAG: class I SAM-dependent methyltransferase [Candidatus Magasanikbacteria bacterium]|uniref:Methyltransferase type 11 domain-containing protein n=1 Tax=Candidatus Magasanikbacteria bacterium CG10_big_fil_rev_8_21_14_0_10_38_6 TaxID=1974647 RepID=A0A2M6P1P1_9BACT|nr:class I SAM-dependent methyltransferase [Candidatus Magasanikbacteria bacterium]PIR77340.1 MAG: hypothetical protein COU30_03030 [Candidatus Magasanikbacteria bacterium CG10_big_fil_rev_8_21_14_0_10_38_6]
MEYKHGEQLLGWGTSASHGAEIWDAKPLFVGDMITWKDRLMLLFYPKKFFLYRFIGKAKRQKGKEVNLLKEPFRILDVGCGTGAAMVDMKKLYGRTCDVFGVDVIRMQIDIARNKMKSYGVWPHIKWYDGVHLPFGNKRFDAIYCSDVLGHVEDVPAWLKELSSVLRPGGVVAMFSESKLGKHAYIRNYFMKRGLNTDPHAEYHISLYSKSELTALFKKAGLDIVTMRSSYWAKFFVHPDELYEALQGQKKFIFWKILNRLLYSLKKKTAPYSLALAELYGLFDMMTLGRWVESQGYVILAKKQRGKKSRK